MSKVTTSAGSVDLKPNLFLRPRSGPRAQAVNAQAPAATFAAAAAAAGAGSSLAAGAYRVKVTAVNDAGESAPVVATGSPVTLLAGENIATTMSSVPAGVKYFRLYVSAAGDAAGSEKFVGNYSSAQSVLRYNGSKQPGLGEAFLLDLSAECMKFKQLAPLSKINFAIVTTALEFAIVLYGALFVYTPRFNCFLKNVGKN